MKDEDYQKDSDVEFEKRLEKQKEDSFPTDAEIDETIRKMFNVGTGVTPLTTAIPDEMILKAPPPGNHGGMLYNPLEARLVQIRLFNALLEAAEKLCAPMGPLSHVRHDLRPAIAKELDQLRKSIWPQV